MSTVTFTSTNYPEKVEIEPDFPKCLCGGEFLVQDCYNKRRVHKGTMADCKECGEHFVAHSYKDMKRAIPSGQMARWVHKTGLSEEEYKAHILGTFPTEKPKEEKSCQ